MSNNHELETKNKRKCAVCFLTRTPHEEIIRFAKEIGEQQSTIDVYIMIDDNTYQPPEGYNNYFQFVRIDNAECCSHGYKMSSHLVLQKECMSWDKSIYFFCMKKIEYDFVWLVEDDTFIPSVQALVSLNDQASSGQYDLVCQKNDHNPNGRLDTWAHWHDAQGKFQLPWYHSMVCAIGVSRRLLNEISKYAKYRGFLPFIEYMFNTIAMQANLRVHNPPELSTIIWRQDWPYEQIQARPMNWYHPIKDFNLQRAHRQKLIGREVPIANNNNTEYQQYQPVYYPYGQQQPQYPYSMPPQPTYPTYPAYPTYPIYPGEPTHNTISAIVPSAPPPYPH
ncbi:unnamed protein product [Didymodactylos carnosus]|uniref:Uncharacterized protein n=1 Tax=Didymodactylos carnosus TaxID=1234261 RepID=A0A815GX98_9BILA|nr:unnamed protein product [Didymodactylos carnosus]CAF1344612.1 unnamed protein product [Didymodactylos carnosus]CAF4104512.1 unnamed protein product [Didymodactylos carnosus]CAF4208982.1 unnamed protein product [Didymodactylos carnosus]